jgi:tetratricopeptide (TPR) repeat protein
MRTLLIWIGILGFCAHLSANPTASSVSYDFSKPENVIAFLFEIKTLPDSTSIKAYREPIQQILANPTGTLSKKNLAYLHYSNGKIYQEEKIYKKALEEFYKALDLAMEGNHLVEKGISRMEIGSILLEKNTLKEAGQHLKAAISILKHSEGTRFLPRAKYLYAKWLYVNGYTRDAIENMADAVEGFNLEAKFENGAAIALDFGLQLSKLRMFDQAEEFLKAALFYYRMEERKEQMGTVFLALTDNKIRARDFDDAMIYNQQALTVFRALEANFALSTIHWNFAQIFSAMEQHEETVSHLQLALKRLKKDCRDMDSYELVVAIAEKMEKMGLQDEADDTWRFLAQHTPTLASNFLDREIIEVTGKYETALKTQAYASEIEKLTREKRMAQKASWMLAAIFC